MLDALWLGVVSREFYKARLGQLLLDQPNWAVAILFYLVHAVGIVVFAGAAGGVVAVGGRCTARCSASCVYAAYDLTNLATLRGWPMARKPGRSRLGSGCQRRASRRAPASLLRRGHVSFGESACPEGRDDAPSMI